MTSKNYYRQNDHKKHDSKRNYHKSYTKSHHNTHKSFNHYSSKKSHKVNRKYSSYLKSNKHHYRKKHRVNYKYFIFAIFLLIFIGIFLYYSRDNIQFARNYPNCSDGTYYNQCSETKPFYCFNGTLIKKASICGCPVNEVPFGENCTSTFTTDPTNRVFKYILNGKTKEIHLIVYKGLNDYLSELPRTIYYSEGDPPPTDKDFIYLFINNKIQSKFLMPLVEKIKSRTSNKDDQARIAISLVQHIPYDWASLKSHDTHSKYPYEVLYDYRGVCEEKSLLLAFLLKHLGFGVVLFSFKFENHMAVGIKCPMQYSYKKTGYCFVESTNPTIITDSNGNYIKVGKLSSIPKTIHICDGLSLNSVAEEYNDAQELIKINKQSESSGGQLDRVTYDKWLSLIHKYDINVTT